MQKDWYALKRSDIYELGGRSLLTNHHANSLSKAIMSTYPEYTWDENLFQEVHRIQFL